MTQFLAWCEAEGVLPMVKSSRSAWIAHLLDSGVAPATARTRMLGMRRLTKWLVSEDELDADPFTGMLPPKLDETVIEPLTEDDLRAMVKACAATKGAAASEVFRGRRDEALVRFMFETGTRASEVLPGTPTKAETKRETTTRIVR